MEGNDQSNLDSKSRGPVPGINSVEFMAVRLELIAQSAIRLPYMMACVAFATVLVLRHQVGLLPLIGWAIVSTTMYVLTALNLRRIQTHYEDSARPYALYRIHVFLGALTGLADGATAPLFLSMLDNSTQTFIATMIFGLVAGSVVATPCSPMYLLLYSSAALFPFAMTWHQIHGNSGDAMLFMAFIFVIVVYFFSLDSLKVTYASFLLRHERDEAQQRAEQLAQAKSRILAAASHDLRQPLHALSLYSAVLEMRPPPDALREVASNINQLVRSLGSLLDGLLDLSHLDSQSFPVHQRATCIGSVAQQLADEIAVRAQEKGVDLHVDLSSLHRVLVMTDPLVLERILRNLLDNALKYTAAGSISFSVRVEGAWARMQIRDTGKGIAEDELDRVFEEFYQIDNPGRDRSQGLGLGLSLVKRMVDVLGISMEFVSTLGVGTTVTLSLPLCETVTSPVPDLNESISSALEGKTVLVLDDEDAILSSMKFVLERWGMRALCASNAEEMTQHFLAEGRKIDAVIADLRLARGENGVHLVQHVHQRFGFVPTLIISGETLPERLRDAVAANFKVVHKPISQEVLYAALLQLTHSYGEEFKN